MRAAWPAPWVSQANCVQLAERLRATWTKTEPRRSSDAPKPHPSTFRVHYARAKSASSHRSPRQPSGPGRSCSREGRPRAPDARPFWKGTSHRHQREVFWGIPGVAQALPVVPGPRCGGRTRPLSPPSPEVDLIPASFAGAKQHRRGPILARSSCLQTSAQEKQIV